MRKHFLGDVAYIRSFDELPLEVPTVRGSEFLPHLESILAAIVTAAAEAYL